MPKKFNFFSGRYPTIRLPVILMLFGVWVAVGGFLVWDYRQELASGQQQSKTLSRSLATHAEQVLSDARRLAYIIEDSVRTEGITTPIGRFMPTGSVNNQLILQLSLVDTQGVLRSSTTPGFQAIDLSDREHIRVHLNDGYRGMFISKPLVGRASNRLSVQLTSPLEDRNGNLLGILVISIDPAQLTERYRKLNIGSNGLIALIGAQDYVIRLVRSSNRLHGLEPGVRNPGLLNSSDELPDQNAPAPGGHPVTPTTSFQPAGLLLSTTQIPGYPLAVVVGLATSDLLAPFYKRRATLLGATALLTLLTLLAEWRHARLSRQARDSERRLSDALAQVLARERRFADLFRAIPDPVIAFSKEHRCATGFNQPMNQLAQASGVAIDGIDTDRFASAVFASDVSGEKTRRAQALTKTLNEALDDAPDGKGARFEIQIDTPAPVIYEVRINPMPDEPVGMLVILRDITAQHRLETGQGAGRSSPLDLRDLIPSLLQQLPEAESLLHIQIPATPVTVLSNMPELVTALRNAVENALKYGHPEKGIELKIWADTEQGQARIVVSDQGPGVSGADIDRIFKRFVRLDGAGNLEGSGLGLPLVRGILQHHKGWAWVESAPGKGFHLHMTLPLQASPNSTHNSSSGLLPAGPRPV